MKSKKMKQALALLCAGAMTVTGMNLPVNVMSTDAAADWTWNALVSESGYRKVPFKELSAIADTEAASEGASTGGASRGTGRAVNVVDGVTSSYYHSAYEGNKQPIVSDGTFTGNNTITITLNNPESVQGVTYLPRQDSYGNGAIREFSVQVQKEGSTDWENVPEIFQNEYPDASQSTWTSEHKAEKELVFENEIENVKKIKLTVTHSAGLQWNRHISGAEISVLKPHREALQDKVEEMDSIMALNVREGDETSGKVYDSSQYDVLKQQAEELLNSESATDEDLKNVLTQLENLEYKFSDSVGTGRYLSDMTQESGTSGWHGIVKDQCPDQDIKIKLKNKAGTVDTYTKGIGAHEPSTIVYNVEGYKKFVAEIGACSHHVDGTDGKKAVGADEKAHFVVSGSADNTTYTELYSNEALTPRTGAEHIDINIPDDVKYLKLECRNKEGNATLHTCWANAKVYDSVAVADITLDKESLSLKTGEKATLTPTFNPTNATNKEVVWESEDDSVATVNENGEIEAVGVGETEITVKSKADDTITDSCIVTVTADKAALGQAIAAADEKMEEEDFEVKYTAESLADFTEAYEYAVDVNVKADATIEEVNIATESLKAAIEGLQAKFVVTINNNGTTETKYCEAGDQVTVVAKPAPEGQKFSHWTVNGTPISYKESYTFIVYGDTTVEAKYVAKDEVVEQEATIMCTSYYDVATSKAVFTAKRSLPAGSKVIEHGIIMTDSTGWSKLGNEGFVIGAERTVKGTAKTTGLIGNYTCSMKSTRDTTWYGKGYVRYTDKDGVEHTLYSEVTSCKVIQ